MKVQREKKPVTSHLPSVYLYACTRVKLKKKKFPSTGIKLQMNGAFELCQLARGVYLFSPCITGIRLIGDVLLSKQHQCRDTD